MTNSKLLQRSGICMVFTYLLTTAHHLYSSTIYAPDSSLTGVFSGSWRVHGFLAFLIPVLACLGVLGGYAKWKRRELLYGYGLLNGLIFVGLIGLWEGGWNHLVKILFFALGIERLYAYGPGWLTQFPMVLPPTDLFFEATGVATLVVGLVNACYLLKLFDRDLRARGPSVSAIRAAPVDTCLSGPCLSHDRFSRQSISLELTETHRKKGDTSEIM